MEFTRTGAWESWRVSEGDPVLRRSAFIEGEDGQRFEAAAAGGGRRVETLVQDGPLAFTWTVRTFDAAGDESGRLERRVRRP